MSKDKTIMLASPYSRDLFREGDGLYIVSEKLDGMPVRITITEDGKAEVLSRQGEHVTSIDHIVKELVEMVRSDPPKVYPFVVVGELYEVGRPQKYIRGRVVRKGEQYPECKLYVFPPFSRRIPDGMVHAQVVPYAVMYGTKLVNYMEHNSPLNALPPAIGNPVEGYIAYKLDEPWVEGKRSKGYIKLVKSPTLDLRVVGLEEAISKEGKPLGRVGAFVCRWADGTTKVGAGKLSHAEARELYNKYSSGFFMQNSPMHLAFNEQFIIEVKYMPDASYAKLRQPTFQKFRDDKVEYQTDYDKWETL